MISGIHDKKLVEIVELENHPFFVGTQFHPEFTSRPGDPNPIIHNFIRSCVESLKNKFNEGWVEEK
jgi:CTP synthase